MTFRLKASLIAVALFAACRAIALEIYGAEAFVRPNKIYVGQYFEIEIDVVASQNGDLSIGSPQPMPDTIRLGVASPSNIKERTGKDGRNECVHAFVIQAIADVPISYRGRTLQLPVELSVRTQSFFGTQTMRRTGVLQLHMPAFEVLPLPEDGMPEDFSGAVGSFRITADVEPSELAPGDIAKLTVALKGTGNPGNGDISLPEMPPEFFKVYPPERLPEGEGCFTAICASVIPLSTQSLDIASARFVYFDPVAEKYSVAESKPLRLTFRERAAQTAPSVRTIDFGSRNATELAGDMESMRLRIAPAETALETSHEPKDGAYDVLETSQDGKWIRVRIRKSGRTGWLPSPCCL